MYSRSDSEALSYNLPRKNGIAYAAQESWVLNDTIRVSSIQLDADQSSDPSLFRITSSLARPLTSRGIKRVGPSMCVVFTFNPARSA